MRHLVNFIFMDANVSCTYVQVRTELDKEMEKEVAKMVQARKRWI